MRSTTTRRSNAARAGTRAVRLTGRVAVRHLHTPRLRHADLPVYDVVVSPARLREPAGLLGGSGAVLVVREA